MSSTHIIPLSTSDKNALSDRKIFSLFSSVIKLFKDFSPIFVKPQGFLNCNIGKVFPSTPYLNFSAFKTGKACLSPTKAFLEQQQNKYPLSLIFSYIKLNISSFVLNSCFISI